MKNTQRRRRLAALTVGVAAAAVVAGYTYLNSSYPAAEQALAAMESTDTVRVYEPADDIVVFAAEEPEAGLVFYPGGKVEHTAYAPLLRALAERGITCVLPEMPFDLAVLDMDAAQQARETVTGIETWYIGGHSLGGAMAANYAAENAEAYDGLVLLASYSTKDLKNKGLKVISLYGTEDMVLNMEKYEEYRKNLPENVVEDVLNGGNHAQFGDYGVQDGDGTALVLPEEQVAWTSDILTLEILN